MNRSQGNEQYGGGTIGAVVPVKNAATVVTGRACQGTILTQVTHIPLSSTATSGTISSIVHSEARHHSHARFK